MIKMDSIRIEEKRKIVRNYIRKKPNCTYKDIRRDTKIKIERIYKNMREACEDAGVKMSKNLTKRDKNKQQRAAIEFIKKNPTAIVTEIQDDTNINIPRLFGSIQNVYRAAGIRYPKRKVTSGARNPFVLERCRAYEKYIISILETLGEVETKRRTTSGIVDCLFTFNKNTFVVEIKDYRGKKNITMTEIKQLIRYMKDLRYNTGLVICPRESFPKRKNKRNIYIDDFAIKILSEADLRGCSIKDIMSVQSGRTVGSSDGAMS